MRSMRSMRSMRRHAGSAALLATLLLSQAGCGTSPQAAEIESVSMQAAQRGDEAAERRLAGWARDGLPVAQRELGLLYRMRAAQGRANRANLNDARAMFLRAARQGDPEAAYQLGELERMAGGADGEAAVRWYRQAAEHGHAKAALALALMFKNGDHVARDAAAAVHWLDLAAKAGDAHAMFLLSNAYADGDGVAADPRRARVLLENAADHEYPAAIQQLALVKQTGDAYTGRDENEARQLIQEGAEHRRANARRF